MKDAHHPLVSFIIVLHEKSNSLSLRGCALAYSYCPMHPRSGQPQFPEHPQKSQRPRRGRRQLQTLLLRSTTSRWPSCRLFSRYSAAFFIFAQ